MFYGAFPPEFNSGRMYSGPGAGSLVAAATAWQSLATELQSTATSYAATISSLTAGPWAGPSSFAMASAAAPYVAWMQQTAAAAAQSATQATEAATAYETAFAAHAAGGDRRKPGAAGAIGGDEPLRAEHVRDRRERGPIRRVLGAGRHGDGHLLRVLGDRFQ